MLRAAWAAALAAPGATRAPTSRSCTLARLPLVQLSKEVRALRTYEAGLLDAYHTYLKALLKASRRHLVTKGSCGGREDGRRGGPDISAAGAAFRPRPFSPNGLCLGACEAPRVMS